MSPSMPATLDPVNSQVRAEASRLADRLQDSVADGSTVGLFVQSILQDVAQGERVVVLRQDQEVTPSQAADMLGVTRQFVDRLCGDGVLGFRRLPGSRHRRILVSDVVTLIAQRQERQSGHAAIRDAFADAGLLENA